MDQMYQLLKRLRRSWGAREGVCHKKPYGSREEADLASQRILHYHGGRRYAYQCWCGAWHLTSQPQAQGK